MDLTVTGRNLDAILGRSLTNGCDLALSVDLPLAMSDVGDLAPGKRPPVPVLLSSTGLLPGFFFFT